MDSSVKKGKRLGRPLGRKRPKNFSNKYSEFNIRKSYATSFTIELFVRLIRIKLGLKWKPSQENIELFTSLIKSIEFREINDGELNVIINSYRGLPSPEKDDQIIGILNNILDNCTFEEDLKNHLKIIETLLAEQPSDKKKSDQVEGADNVCNQPEKRKRKQVYIPQSEIACL